MEKWKIRKVHCFFEQSGTFKNEFIKLGIAAEDYDIQNAFGQTDHVIDLFGEIEKAYDNLPSIFDDISDDDLIMAFFPCIYFETMQANYYSGRTNNLWKKEKKEKYEIIFDRINKRNKFYLLIYKLYAVCDLRGLKLIIENPATQPHYLVGTTNFPLPTFIDKDRTRRGDCFKKPTAYWFVNIEPTNGKSYCKLREKKLIQTTKRGTGGICSTERSMIEPIYARNFICDFILGEKNENTERDLFG